MFTSHMLSQVLHGSLIVVIIWLAFLFFKAQKRQNLCNNMTDRKIEGILQEVQFTNKRLIVLEEWRKTMTSQIEEVHGYAQFMRDRVDGLLSKIIKEEHTIVKKNNKTDLIISPSHTIQVNHRNILLRFWEKIVRQIKLIVAPPGRFHY